MKSRQCCTLLEHARNFLTLPSGKVHWLRTKEVIDDPCLNAIAFTWQSELVRQRKRNSTNRKEGSRKNSVMPSGNGELVLLLCPVVDA
jgi:hypothetical protein